MWDSLTRKDFGQLGSRMFFGFFALSSHFFAIRELPLVLVTIAMNTMPLFTAIFGYLFFGEFLENIQKIVLVVSFIGVAVMVTGDREQLTGQQQFSIVALCVLMINPIASACVTLTLRSLKGIGGMVYF